MTGSDEQTIGGILLAAGGSARFGSPKQLFPFENETLLRRAAKMLAASECEPVVVVLGAEVDQSRREIADLPVNVCINQDWQDGMSSSIVAGLTSLLDRGPSPAAVVISLCDQPYVTSADIDLFIAEFRRSNAPIIAAEYDGISGVPALFSSEMFSALLGLKGDRGARSLIRGTENPAKIKLEQASFDLDFPTQSTSSSEHNRSSSNTSDARGQGQ